MIPGPVGAGGWKGSEGSPWAFERGAWRSLVAHLLWEQRVGGSNPSAPTSSNCSAPVAQLDRAPAF
jgi:hypothetical protein